jgi:hypothetical protein
MQNTIIVPRIVQVLMVTTLPAAHTEAERRSSIRNRHPEEESARSRSRIIDWRRVIVPFHDNRTIVMLNVNRSWRHILVMVMNPLLVVAVSVPPVMPTVVVC